MIAIDAAIKVGGVELTKLGPPTETNFAGAYLSGLCPHVKLQREAFAAAVIDGQVTPRPASIRTQRAARRCQGPPGPGEG